MYTGREHKQVISRVIGKPKRMNMQSLDISDDYKNTRFSKAVLPTKPLKGYIQYQMNPYGTYNLMGLPAIPQNVVFNSGVQPLTGSPISSEVFISNEVPQTRPADLINMTYWKNYGNLKLLKDLHTNNTLTRMHVINGTFHGPSNCNNMILGTAASNNYDTNSHYNKVEDPIRKFLQNCPYPRAVYYKVVPHYTPPLYIRFRYFDIKDNVNRNNFINWSFQGCPDCLDCHAIFYIQTNGQIFGRSQHELVNTDL